MAGYEMPHQEALRRSIEILCMRVANMPPAEYNALLISHGLQPKQEEPYKGRRLEKRPSMPLLTFTVYPNDNNPMPVVRDELMRRGFTCNDFFAAIGEEVTVEVYPVQ